MDIKLLEITVRDLCEGYVDNLEDGVVGYGGKLDIRPPYQREFIYKDAQRDAVIDTVSKNFPLNVMYWSVKANGEFEIIDGQQRTISLCQYVIGDFSVRIGSLDILRAFHNLQDDEKKRILDYKLTIYLCKGTDSERLEWFRTINIAGEKLNDQELRNAVYSGSWVTDAKRYFSKNNCPAFGYGNDYMSGSPIRQEYLEAVIKWKSDNEIEKFMSSNQFEKDAKDLWLYFQNIIDWVKEIFPEYRKIMKGIQWGDLFNKYKDKLLIPEELEKEISYLIQDEDVTSKKGIYTYVLSRDEKNLSIRAFTAKQKMEAYEKQKGICIFCKKFFELNQMEADHITPWSKGGKTTSENCQMLCKKDNRKKSSV